MTIPQFTTRRLIVITIYVALFVTFCKAVGFPDWTVIEQVLAGDPVPVGTKGGIGGFLTYAMVNVIHATLLAAVVGSLSAAIWWLWDWSKI
jgi:tetrahydromethanopterin S-methyltransferase subunit E